MTAGLDQHTIAPVDRTDLHTHTTASDGLLSPAELVAEASQRGVSVLGITDHDTIAGIGPALAAAHEIRLSIIPGVELSTTIDVGEVHVLGYFVPWEDAAFVAKLTQLAEGRKRRIRTVIQKLRSAGYDLDEDRVMSGADEGSIGRPHVARALIEIGAVRSVSEAFDTLLRRGKPGFVARDPFGPEQAVGMLAEHGALPVLAHPFSSKTVKATVRRLVPAGLRGIEVYYGEYDAEQQRSLKRVADTWGLLATGGSDFHGVTFREGRELGSVDVPDTVAPRLRAAYAALSS